MAATTNKQQVLTLALTALKKKFPAGPEPEKRPVLEEVIYAILREGVTTVVADAAYARMREAFFDWNEVRVSTIQEVSDVLGDMPDVDDRSKRAIEFLQEHFERDYSFSLDDLEKKGLKQAAKQLARYKGKGVTDFVVAWVTQRSLGGHAVPLDGPTLRVLARLGVVENDPDDLEAVRATVEHFIPKAKGYEFTEELIQHADAICIENIPLCPVCPLKSDCPTGLEMLAKAKEPKPRPKSR